MNLYRLEEMVGGWFVGNFSPTAFTTKDVEVSYKKHPKGEIWDIHYHEHVTEVNLLVRGKMILQGKTLSKGDIFVLNPFEIANPEFLEDCEIVCVKMPGITNDKVVLNKKEKAVFQYISDNSPDFISDQTLQQFTSDEVEPVDYKKYINDNDVIVQIGAYNGVECEERYGLRERILNHPHECHLIEPLPSIFEDLQQNYKDSINKINFYNLAIYDFDGEKDFYMNGTESSFIRHTDCQTIKVKTQTISTFLKENNITNINALFLDVEGVEDVIIRQLFETTDIRPKIIRYEYPHIKDNKSLEDYICSKDYFVSPCMFGAGDKVCIKKP